MSDAWEEDENDAIRIDQENDDECSRVHTISGGDVRSALDVEVEFSSDRKRLPEQLTAVKKDDRDQKSSRPSPLNLLCK